MKVIKLIPKPINKREQIEQRQYNVIGYLIILIVVLPYFILSFEWGIFINFIESLFFSIMFIIGSSKLNNYDKNN